MPSTSFINRTRDSFFSHIHGNNLVYNLCWEDPRLDRIAMQLDHNSRVVMITSAGCNALCYLLDQPAHIHAIDMNPRQNALLELKQAIIRSGDAQLLSECFAAGQSRKLPSAYAMLRAQMNGDTAAYWDKHLHFFDGKGSRNSFYHQGTSGFFAWAMSKTILRDRTLRTAVHQLLESATLEDQRFWYAQIETKLWNSLRTWIMNRHAVLALLGVPRSQRNLIQQQYPGGLSQFLKDKLRHVFTEIPVQDNYFWRAYLTGSMSGNCLPEYLKPKNFEVLRKNVDRVSTHTTTVARFLQDNPGKYSHFVLLDHQDWLAAHDVPALNHEWKMILDNAAPDAKILMRSAGVDTNFIPEWVTEQLQFDEKLAESLHTLDRVGTYGCFKIATLR